MLNTLAIPLQLVCQLIGPGNFDGGNTTLALDGSLRQQATVLPHGFTAFPEIGMAYKYFGSDATWNSARKMCIAHDSSLAVIDSFKKIRAVQSIKTNAISGVFVGIHRLFGDGEWLNLKTGLPMTVIPWAPEKLDGNCLSLWHDGRGVSAVPCGEVRNFVCEVPLVLG